MVPYLEGPKNCHTEEEVNDREDMSCALRVALKILALADFMVRS